MPTKISTPELAEQLCTRLNYKKTSRDTLTDVVTRFAKDKGLAKLETRTNTADPNKDESLGVVMFLEIETDEHHFYLYFYKQAQEWRTQKP